MADAPENFDVEMPDGTIISDVPKGTTRKQVIDRYSKTKTASPEDSVKIKDVGLGVAGTAVGLPVGAAKGVVSGAKGAYDLARTSPLLFELRGLEEAKRIGEAPERISQFAKEKYEEFKKAKPFQKGMMVGETVGEFLGPGKLAKGAVGLGRKVYGVEPELVSQSTSKMESRGYKFTAPQLREEKPIKSPGRTIAEARKNQDLSTKETTTLSGAPTTTITPQWFKEQIGRKDGRLTKEYDRIFNRNFGIGNEAAKVLKDVAQFEKNLGTAGSSKISGNAENLYNRWRKEAVDAMMKRMQQQQISISKKKQAIQQKRGVSSISLAQKDFSNLRDASSADVPDWFKRSVNTINELAPQMGFKGLPKVYLGTSRRRGLYGMADRTDQWIIISDAIKDFDGLSTALHEFGHQAEFMSFIHAPEEVKRAVFEAWLYEKKTVPFGTKTIEQLRPITGAKYPELIRTAKPSIHKDEGYFRNFQEWFAEQTSRWITQTKAPTTVVEKFFANVADFWKKLYQKVAGYTPLVQEIDNYYKSLWSGKNFSEHFAEMEGESAVTPSKELKEIFVQPVQAKINGKELQRIRSDLTDVARTATDGKIRSQAIELSKQIDELIVGKDNPQLLEDLRKTNREYAVVKTLETGVEQGWVSKAGKVSLSGMGDHLASTVYGFGSGTSVHPLYDLGAEGRATGITHLEEGTKYPGYDATAAVLGRARHALLHLGTAYTPWARNLQRYLSQGTSPIETLPTPIPGVIGLAAQTEEENKGKSRR